jgi:F0F1-type ATP synthase membrane subunit b/b'
MVAIRKTQRRANKTIARIGKALTQAKKHHRQTQNTVKKIKAIHETAKVELKAGVKGIRKTAKNGMG